MMTEAPPQPARMAWLPLLLAIGIMLGVTIYPAAVTRADGQADHGLLMLICWGMSAGFVRGVGFIPRHPALRWLLSSAAALTASTVSVLIIAHAHGWI